MSVRSPESVVVGVDLSLTSTGLARIAHTSDELLIETSRLKPKMKGHERLELIEATVAQWCASADLVVLEGPSYGSQSSSYHQLAGMWWLVRHGLWKQGKAVAIVAPQARAKYAAGKGNAGKDEVLSWVIRRYGIPLDVAVDGNDIADALTMAAMGRRHLGWAVEPKMPELNAEALAKVDWPLATP